jgi:hypothetical protein
MLLAIDARMLRFPMRFTTISVLVSTYSVLIAGSVRIPVPLRIRIPICIATVGVGVSVAAVATIVAGRIVRITWAAAETTCSQCCGQDPAQQHNYFSRVNRFHTIPFGPHSEPSRLAIWVGLARRGRRRAKGPLWGWIKFGTRFLCRIRPSNSIWHDTHKPREDEFDFVPWSTKAVDWKLWMCCKFGRGRLVG